MIRFLGAGGDIQKRTIASFSQLANDRFDVVVNCTGLGAKELCNDRKLQPLRGQIIKVYAPWIKTVFYGDYDTYIIPGFDGIVTLGGSRTLYSSNMNVCHHERSSIRERCEALVPSLNGARVIREAVGLRPHRDPVRVESELYSIGSNIDLKIVHNYGHSGYGVTTSPGTAKHSVKLVKEFLMGSGRSKL